MKIIVDKIRKMPPNPNAISECMFWRQRMSLIPSGQSLLHIAAHVDIAYLR
jgi:hypothetical protein